ncbi:MAG: hypothetical protein RLZ55_709 [Actinomycetota bacterium]
MRSRSVIAGVGLLAVAGVLATGCSSPGASSSGSASGGSQSGSAASSAAPSPSTTTVAEQVPTTACTMAPDTRVTDLTFGQLQQYALNNGESIPTLAEYLDLANAKKVGVLPEIKTFAATTGDAKPVPTDAQYAQYTAMVSERADITEVLIGSFDEFTLKYFNDNKPEWTRVWFRSLGGSDPATPPTVAEMKERAPSANSLGVINVLYTQGTFPANGQPYNVPQEFADAGIPVYIWYNTITKGDTAVDGPNLGEITSPGWQSIASLQPHNVKWIATDMVKEYTAWAQSAPESTQPVPQMVAHRGGGQADTSENSMAAFNEAAANGAKVLETDVQWTKATPENPNGVPVLMHDATINRTTRCK